MRTFHMILQTKCGCTREVNEIFSESPRDKYRDYHVSIENQKVATLVDDISPSDVVFNTRVFSYQGKVEEIGNKIYFFT